MRELFHLRPGDIPALLGAFVLVVLWIYACALCASL